MLSGSYNTAAARRFSKRAVSKNGVPNRIVMNKIGANLAGLRSLHAILKFKGLGRIIGIV